MKLLREFYSRKNTLLIAKELLGKLIVIPDEDGNRVSAMIVETEAYLGVDDRAAHSYGGRRTPRNEVMYGMAGHAYVFFIYGMYYQFNVVCGPVGTPHAILIRGVEPVEGIDKMRERRGFLTEPGAVATGFMADKNLTSGPGKLCIAMAIDKSLNGEDLLGTRVWLEDHQTFKRSQIVAGKRIGIDYAGEDAEKPWRFWVNGNQFISKT